MRIAICIIAMSVFDIAYKYVGFSSETMKGSVILILIAFIVSFAQDIKSLIKG